MAQEQDIKDSGLIYENGSFGRTRCYEFWTVCRGLGWSKAEVQVYLVDVRKCLMDNSVHSYFPFHVSYEQKPENETKDE